MTPKKMAALGLLGVTALAFLFWSARKYLEPVASVSEATINVGWQKQWATQGQIMEALEKTNIPVLYGAKLSLRDFQYGPDLNEAAITGSVHVTNAGIVPVVNLLAKSSDWIIVARHIDFLVAIVARTNSGVTSVRDLKGRVFGVPVAGGTHPYALSRLRENGLTSGDRADQVHVINAQPIDQPAMMRTKSVDAVAIWEPTISVLLRDNAAVIDSDTYCSFIVIRKSFAQSHRAEVVKMLKAYVEAFLYAAQHKQQVDVWFSDVSGIDYSLVSNIHAIEPAANAKTISEDDLSVDANRAKKAQQVADTMQQLGLIETTVNVKDRIDVSFYEQAVKELKSESPKTQEVRPR